MHMHVLIKQFVHVNYIITCNMAANRIMEHMYIHLHTLYDHDRKPIQINSTISLFYQNVVSSTPLCKK